MHIPLSRRKSVMSAEPMLTSDVVGLTKVAPFSRRGFMTATVAQRNHLRPAGLIVVKANGAGA
jgi:hypothetical protein